jgi:hypothetical protein
MIINIVFGNNFVMNEIGENNGHENMDQTPNWTNLACPSCAIYYGIQLLVRSIKKKRRMRKNRRSTIMPNNNAN